MLDACELPHEYGNTRKMPAALMLLFEELHKVHCGEENRRAVQWVGLSCGQFG